MHRVTDYPHNDTGNRVRLCYVAFSSTGASVELYLQDAQWQQL